MEHSILIANIILSMREYQQHNNIKKQCVTNTQYLYDTIKMNSTSNVAAKAVIVFSSDDETNTTTFVGGHLVIVLDNETYIDPSYDVFSLKNKSYFDNIKDLIGIFDDTNQLATKIDVRQIIYQHLEFMNFAEQINNGECLITDKKFYNQQADYIEKLYSK
jgi:hypothetical protein